MQSLRTTMLAVAICATGCGSKSAPTTDRESPPHGSASGSGQDSVEAAFDKALAESAAGFDAWLAQFLVVGKSFDGKNCDAFVAQVKTLESKLVAFSLPMKPYVDDPARMQKFEDSVKPKSEAMQNAENKAAAENFVNGVKTCEKHPELQGALERGMPRKKQ